MYMKKIAAACLSVLLVIGSVAIPGTSVFAAGGTEVYSEGFEGYAANTDLHYYGKYTAEGEPETYGVAGKLSTNMLAGYLAQDENGTIYRTTFGATVYGRDGTAYTQTATKGATGSSDVIQVSNALAHSGTKSLMLKPNARVMSLPLEVKGGTSYQLTFYGTNNGVQGNGSSNYFGATVMTTLNIGKNGTLGSDGSTVAAGSGGDISSITGLGATYNDGANVFCLAHTGKILYEATNEFIKFTLNFTTSAEETYTTVYLSFFGSSNMIYYIDDISLVDVTPAPEVATEVYDLSGNQLENAHEYLPVTAAESNGGVTLAVNTAALADYVEFVGWYQNGSLATFEDSLSVAKNQVSAYKARFVTKNLAASSGSFENLNVDTDLRYFPTHVTEGEPVYGVDGKWTSNIGAGVVVDDGGTKLRATYAATVYGKDGTAYQQSAKTTGDAKFGTAQVTDAMARTGKNSLKVSPGGVPLSLPLYVKPSTTYRITFYMNNNNVAGNGNANYLSAAVLTTLNIGWNGQLDSEGNIVTANQTCVSFAAQSGAGDYAAAITNNVFALEGLGKKMVTASTEWQKCEMTFTTSENAANHVVYLSLGSPSGTFYIDDISLVDTSAGMITTGITTAYNNLAALRTSAASDTGKNGLRVYNKILKQFIIDKNIVEYGSIVTLESKINAAIGELTFENGSGTYVTGISWNQQTQATPILWEQDDTANVYTAYLTGIPTHRYDDNYVIRAYAKDENGVVFYGKELKISVFDIVYAIDCGNGVASVTEQDKAAFTVFAEGTDMYASYDTWLKQNLKMPGSLRNAAKSADTLSGAALTAALENEGDYAPLFARSIANTGNRALLKKVLEKEDKTINLVGFGGSITLGDTSREKDSYVSYVRDWLVQKGYTVHYSNAGIGGTTSVLGIARISEQVLACDPDLVIVDFTTNDQTDAFYADSYEAIIRTLMQNGIATIGIMFGNIDRAMLEQGVYQKGTNREELHAPVLLYYDIPIINYYGAMWESYLDADGDGINADSDAAHWNVLWQDYIHPNAAGHRLAGNAVCYYLNQVYNGLNVITDEAPVLKAVLGDRTESFMGAVKYEYDTAGSLVTATTGNVIEGAYNNGDGGHYSLWKSWVISEGGSVTFTIPKCKSVGIMRAMTADRGTATISINGKVITDIATFSGKMNYLQDVHFGDGKETVTVTVTATSGTYEITSMLIAQGE